MVNDSNTFLASFEPLNLPIHGVRLPTFIVEEAYRKEFNIAEGVDNYEFLRALCLHGFSQLKLKKDSPEYKLYAERTKYELDIIKELGFVDYILLCWDVINFCKRNDIPTGYGRGSAAGSLVLFLIGVTKVNPIKYSLFFERFISRIRAKRQVVDGVTYLDGSLMCDVDLDICFYNRHKVIAYLEQKFAGRVCKILTFNTLSAKLLIKECGKIMTAASDDDMTRVTEMIPKVHGKVMDIDEAYRTVEDFSEWCNAHRDVFNTSLKLRDLIKNKGVHPSAISISFFPLAEFTPTELDSEKSTVASYDMNWVSLFNVKLDVLGLRGVSVVDDVCKSIGISMADIDFENPFIYQQLQDLKTPHGIFQLEADTNYGVACKVKPRNLEELSAVVALARPGAIQFVDQFANYTCYGQYEAVHPFFDEILKTTGGIAAYQEQLMQMAHKVGFSLDEAEQIRRCVTGDTMFVSKTRGWISIHDLLKNGYENDLFLIMNEQGEQCWKPIRKIWSNGIQQVRHVEARNGLVVKASRWHQFLTDSGWKARNYLTKEDYLVCAKSVEWDGKDGITKDLAIVIAGLVTEGYFVDGRSATFVNYDKDIMSLFVQSFSQEFGVGKLNLNNENIAVIRQAEKEKIRLYLHQGKSASKYLPSIMMGMTKQTTREFLSFIFACEGSFCRESLSLASASLKLIQQLQLLLLRFGIRSSIYKKLNKKYKRFYYTLDIGQRKDVAQFYQELSIHLQSYKKEALQSILANTNQRVGNTVDIIPKNQARKFINQYGYLLNSCSGRFCHNNISRERFQEFASQSLDDRWIKISNGAQEYVKIEETNQSIREVEVFDFTVDEDTPYIIANGIVIHNCVGKKKVEEIKAWEAKIQQKIIENNLDPVIGELLWKICEDSASYSFNKCLSPDTIIETPDGNVLLQEIKTGDKVKAYDTTTKKKHFVEVLDVMPTTVELYEVEFENGHSIQASLEHRFLCEDYVMRALGEIIKRNYRILAERKNCKVMLEPISVQEIKKIGNRTAIDIEVNHIDHNFFANGLVSHNSHSVAYASLAAATIFLKFTYPTQFFLSLLKMSRHEPDAIGEISKIHKEMAVFGIQLLRPHITKSKLDFTIEGKDIRFGLLSVRGISDKSIEKLNGFCHAYSTKFEVFEAAYQHDINIGVLCALIQAGAFEGGFAQSRTKVVYEAQLWNLLTVKEKKIAAALGPEFGFDLAAIVKSMCERKDEKGKVFIKESRFETIKRNSAKYKAIFLMNRASESFANWFYEKTLLGYTHNRTLKDIFEVKIPNLETLREIQKLNDGEEVIFVASVDENAQTRTSKAGNKYLSFDCSDETGIANVKIFAKMLPAALSLNNDKTPKKDNIVIVKGRKKDGGCIFADMYSIQTTKIYTKLSDMKSSGLDKEAKTE